MFLKAPLQLTPYIKEVWIWKDVDPETLPWILPSYEIELVLHLSSSPLINSLDTKPFVLPKIHWVGPQNRRWKIQSEEKLNLISTRFHPGAYWELMGRPTHEILNGFPELDTNRQTLLSPLEELINDRTFFESKNEKALNDPLTSFIESFGESPQPIDANLKFIFQEITNSNIKILDIEKKIGISRKQIERGIKKIYGFSPGELRKIHRILSLIRNPTNYKSEKLDTRLTDIAYEFGYSDQSHLVHDFKTITGYLPKEWFKNYDKMSYFYNSNL